MTVHVNLMKGKCVVFINVSTLVADHTGCEPYGLKTGTRPATAKRLKCKILLLEFNAWEQVYPERESGFVQSPDSTFGGFSAMFCCHSSQMSSALRWKANAIPAQSRCLYSAKPARCQCKAETIISLRQRLKIFRNTTY